MHQAHQAHKALISQLRLSIRRKNIDQLFRTHRNTIVKNQTQQYQQELKNILKNKETRLAWLLQIAAKLTGYPAIQWASIFCALFFGLTVFEAEVEEWDRLGILKAVAEVLAPDYRYLNLYKIACNILTDLLYMCLKSNNQRLAKKILQLNFSDNLLSLALRCPQNPCLRLLGIMCQVAPNLRNYFLSFNLLPTISKYLGDLHEKQGSSSQSFQSLLYLVYSLVKIHQFDQNTFCRPKKSTIAAVLPILSLEILETHSSYNCCLILNALKEICLMEKQQIYEEMIRYSSIFDRALEMLCFENRQEVRHQSAKFICNFLLSPHIEHAEFLGNKNLLNRIFQSYQLPDNKPQNHHILLSILSNFSADHPLLQHQLTLHKLFPQLIIPQASVSPTPQIRRQAVYTICNIIRRGDTDPLCIQVLTEMNGGEALVANLCCADPDVQTVRDVLDCWRQVLGESQMGRESLVYRLVKFRWGVDQILENLSDFDQLEADVLEFSSFLAEFQMQ